MQTYSKLFQRLLVSALLVGALAGCESQFLTQGTIEPEVKGGFWHTTTNGRGNGTTSTVLFWDYSDDLTNTVPTTADSSAPTVAGTSGTFFLTFNELLDGDSIEVGVPKLNPDGDPIMVGAGDYAGQVPWYTAYTGKPVLSIWVNGSEVASTYTNKIAYRADGFLARSYADPISKVYDPAVITIFSSSTALPSGASVVVHVLTGTPDNVILGTSGLPLPAATFADGSVPTLSGGRQIAATYMFKTP